MRRRGLLAAICAAMPCLALAQEPARQEVALTQELSATPEAVWEAIGDFQDMSWHPVVFATEGEGGNDPGASRILTLGEADGPTIAEELTGHDEAAMRYDYRITEVAVETLPVTDYASTLSVMAGPDGGSVVEWRGAFLRGDPGADPAPEANDEAAIAAVGGVYQAGLDALAARFPDE